MKISQLIPEERFIANKQCCANFHLATSPSWIAWSSKPVSSSAWISLKYGSAEIYTWIYPWNVDLVEFSTFFILLTHPIIVLKLPCASWNASFCWTVPELWPFKFESCRGEIRGHFILQGYRYRRTSSLNENEIIHVTSSSVLEFKTQNFTFVILQRWSY